MAIESVSILFALVLAISLVTERVITLVKTALPWIAEDLPKGSFEPARRVGMQVLAFAVAFGTAGFMAQGGEFDLGGVIVLAEEAGTVPVWVMGLLGSGGSAFWKDVLSITNTIKRVRKGEPVT